MLRRTLFLAVVAVLVTAATSAKVQAWGAFHVGYTHVGPGGIQHYGTTRAYGAGGYGGVSHYGATGYGGYHYGATAGYGAAYGGYHYGGAAYGGYHYGGYSAARAGAYRRW